MQEARFSWIIKICLTTHQALIILYYYYKNKSWLPISHLVILYNQYRVLMMIMLRRAYLIEHYKISIEMDGYIKFVDNSQEI